MIKLDALRGTKDEGELSSTRTNLVEVARECHNSKSFPGGMGGFDFTFIPAPWLCVPGFSLVATRYPKAVR